MSCFLPNSNSTTLEDASVVFLHDLEDRFQTSIVAEDLTDYLRAFCSCSPLSFLLSHDFKSPNLIHTSSNLHIILLYLNFIDIH